jgi:methylated-DNA-protein-cysteine methyltransferase-like protein
MKTSFYEEVYSLVKQIPKGRVTSYGRIAAILGKPRAARAVGYALNSLKKNGGNLVPWQRVINSQAKISFKGDSFRAKLQRKLLEKEGVKFDKEDRTDFDKFGWP